MIDGCTFDSLLPSTFNRSSKIQTRAKGHQQATSAEKVRGTSSIRGNKIPRGSTSGASGGRGRPQWRSSPEDKKVDSKPRVKTDSHADARQPTSLRPSGLSLYAVLASPLGRFNFGTSGFLREFKFHVVRVSHERCILVAMMIVT